MSNRWIDLIYGCADEEGLYHITGNFIKNKRSEPCSVVDEHYTKDELKWARKHAKLLGVKGGPKALLKMRWSEINLLAAKKGLMLVFECTPQSD